MQNMDYKYIEQLLERFWNCETSVEEETILKTFFSQEDIPAELLKYKSLFAYAVEEPKADVLGEDFDAKMETLIGENEPVKARVIPFRQRLLPLFKAAAVVAIILSLGNASQMAFYEEQNDDSAAVASMPKVQSGPSVAMGGDSVKIDTLKKAAAVKNILK